MRRSAFVVLVLGVVMSGCAYQAKYDVGLTTVDRQPSVKQIIHGDQLSITNSDNGQVHVYEDDLVKVTWTFTFPCINLRVQNKSDRAIRIPWDYAVYVDPSGISHRITHSGVRMLVDQIAQLPTPIARGSSWEDSIYTVEEIKYYDIPPGLTVDTILPFRSGPLKNPLEVAIKKVAGKAFQILLPIEADSVMHEYLFSFKVNKGSIYVDYQDPSKAKEVQIN